MFIIRAPGWEETWLVSRLIIFPATHNSENFYRKNNLLVFVKTNSALECDQPAERKTPTQRRPTAETPTMKTPVMKTPTMEILASY